MRSATSPTAAEIKDILEDALALAQTPKFISTDPIQIPHSYSQIQDIEIAGLVSSIFAWGQRKTIIAKSKAFLGIMGESPIQFIREAGEEDLKLFRGFKHRTFNEADAFALLRFLINYYKSNSSLEDAFLMNSVWTAKEGIEHFRKLFIQLGKPEPRTLKHFASPKSGSACKRLNMFLRWMVRKDSIDFGLWTRIPKSQLICPLDVHVERVAESLGILSDHNKPWDRAEALTALLAKLDPKDPVKYDLALFTMGAENRIFQSKM